MDVLAKWIENPTAVGATTLLMLAVYALWKGLMVPKWVYDAQVARGDKLEKQRDDLFELTIRNQQITDRAITVASKQGPA